MKKQNLLVNYNVTAYRFSAGHGIHWILWRLPHLQKWNMQNHHQLEMLRKFRGFSFLPSPQSAVYFMKTDTQMNKNMSIKHFPNHLWHLINFMKPCKVINLPLCCLLRSARKVQMHLFNAFQPISRTFFFIEEFGSRWFTNQLAICIIAFFISSFLDSGFYRELTFIQYILVSCSLLYRWIDDWFGALHQRM